MKHRIGVHIEKNAFVDEGDGVVSFPSGLVVTDDSEQWDGTRYDIPTLDISQFKGKLKADHKGKIKNLIGLVSPLYKAGNKVLTDKIKFAVRENPYARLAYNLLIGGYLTDFSTETTGPPPDDDFVYRNAVVYGLSAVVDGNNKSAVVNSIEQAKKDGLDTTELESLVQEPKLTKKGNSMSEVKTKAKSETDKVKTPAETPAAKVDTNAITDAVKAAVAPLQETVDKLEQNAFNKGAKEPSFKTGKTPLAPAKNKWAGKGWEERAVNQIESYRLMSKHNDADAAKTLREINEFNLSELQKKGKVHNDITIGDLGNYVISPEQLTEIQGFRSDYSDVVSRFPFRDTLSTVTQWLKRSGDIDMTHVDYDPAAITDANYLKPVSDYTATLETMELEELAAVTPVANAATRFLAADILGDVNAGYRTDYERKLAQLVVARLEQAVDGNGNSETHNTATDLATVKDFANVIGSVAEKVPNGTLLMNHKSYWKMVGRAAGAGIAGPLAQLVNSGDMPKLFGIPVTLVPNDLLPDIDSAGTVAHTIDGSPVTINHAVFYVNPTNWVGRTSGGLLYDLSTDAAYEISGTVRSAFQRNQIVLRGSFFRGGQVANEDLVAGILAPGVS